MEFCLVSFLIGPVLHGLLETLANRAGGEQKGPTTWLKPEKK